MANRGFATALERTSVELGLKYHLKYTVMPNIPGLTWKVEVSEDGTAATITINCPDSHTTDPDGLKERVKTELESALSTSGKHVPNLTVIIGS